MKPSFGQVLGYIQEGEPLALDLPKRNASIYTSSHFYLNNFPNASEPLSDAPMPHTTLKAAAFETADEGYEGVPFPRPPREFTRPSFLPDSDDGGTDPGQALRNDGLNPPRPPTLGGRMRESGIQAAEAIVAGGAAGAAAAVRSVSENQINAGPAWRRLAGPGRSACAANHRTALGSGAPAAEGGAAGGGGGACGGAGHRELRFAAARGSGSIGGLRHCCRGSGGSSGSGNRGRGWYGSLGAAGRGSPGDGGHGGCCGWRPGRRGSRCCPRRHGVGHRRRAQRGFAPHGLGVLQREAARTAMLRGRA